ncbi:MAG: carboxymuconolactone decarboxylase family protein [Hyphomicrobiales bacterium]|nr:MAG: carboxymuconolactone decarboxylase family protein [Hyphomicrobiales bacterium]
MTDTPSPLNAMQAEVGDALPQSHVDYAERDPDMFTAYLAWRATCLDSGAITRTQKLLMVVAMLTAQKDSAPLRVYASIARSEGATVEELKEALRVGVLFSGGAGIDAAANVADLLDK